MPSPITLRVYAPWFGLATIVVVVLAWSLGPDAESRQGATQYIRWCTEIQSCDVKDVQCATRVLNSWRWTSKTVLATCDPVTENMRARPGLARLFIACRSGKSCSPESVTAIRKKLTCLSHRCMHEVRTKLPPDGGGWLSIISDGMNLIGLWRTPRAWLVLKGLDAWKTDPAAFERLMKLAIVMMLVASGCSALLAFVAAAVGVQISKMVHGHRRVARVYPTSPPVVQPSVLVLEDNPASPPTPVLAAPGTKQRCAGLKKDGSRCTREQEGPYCHQHK